MDFVFELVNNWPVDLWGKFQENSVGVVVPYTDQVHILRAALKQRHPYLRTVSVERVNNVQGLCQLPSYYIVLNAVVSLYTMIVIGSCFY